jgi:hypothetical protein
LSKFRVQEGQRIGNIGRHVAGHAVIVFKMSGRDILARGQKHVAGHVVIFLLKCLVVIELGEEGDYGGQPFSIRFWGRRFLGVVWRARGNLGAEDGERGGKDGPAAGARAHAPAGAPATSGGVEPGRHWWGRDGGIVEAFRAGLGRRVEVELGGERGGGSRAGDSVGLAVSPIDRSRV